MNVIADTGNEAVTQWIRVHYTNRTSAGYCVALNIDMPYNLQHPTPLSPISESNSSIADEQRILDEILPSNIRTDVMLDNNRNISTSTPDGQLMLLILSQCINRYNM